MITKLHKLFSRVWKKNNWNNRNFFLWWLPLAALILYGLILMFFRSTGSFQGDEAIYSQIAREGLEKKEYLNLYWQNKLWFEKPPLVIWLTEISFRLFGISEFSAHIFPGILGIMSAFILYFFSLELFKNRLAAFLSGFIFLTTPIILWSMRSNMMDLPVGFFILASMYSFWKAFNGNRKWWFAFGIFFGLAVMTKSVVGLLPLGLAGAWIVYEKRWDVFRDSFFWQSIMLGLIITLPWHLFMTFNYGSLFWKDYLGYHVVERFFEPILNTPWNKNTLFSYLNLYFERSGSWSIVSIVAIVYAWKKAVRKKYGREILLMLIWILAVLIPFTVAATKLPQYIIPLYFPIALLLGGMIGEMIVRKDWEYLASITAASLLSFLPFFFVRVSDFGEAHVVIPQIFIRYIGISNTNIAYVFGIAIFLLIASILYLKKNQKLLALLFIIIIVGMNIVLPFHPNRNDFIKKLGSDISLANSGKPVELYLIKNPEHFSTGMILPFYLPLGSQVDNIGNRRVMFDDYDYSNKPFCFVEKNLIKKEMDSKSMLVYTDGSVFACTVSEK